MMGRIHVRLGFAALAIAVCALGCGKAAPQIGNFKRQVDPDPPVKPATPAPTPNTQANPGAQNNQPAAVANPQAAPPQVAVVAPSSVPALPAAASIKIEPIDPAWPSEKKHEQTVARLRKISLAIREYAIKEGRLPPAQGKQSWRVLLLPYLGHADQFAKFSLQEAWDSPANVAAAKDVPPVYQSPWRQDDSTCFLAPLGQNAVLAGPVGVEVARLNDKWSSVVELLMVDDAHAVPWSKPADYVVDPAGDRPLGNLGQERTGILVALADGQVRWLPSSTPGRSLRWLLMIGGDEFVGVSTLTQDASAALPFFQIEVSFAERKKSAGEPEPETPLPVGSPLPSPGAIGKVLPPKQQDERVPLPGDDEVEKARSLLKQVFKEEIERTRKGDKTKSKHDLADELIKNADKVDGEPAAHFVLLQTARDSAAAAGDFKLAQQATTSLIRRYQVNDLDLRRRTVTESAKSLLPYYEDQNEDLRKECEQVLKLALQHDDFAAAKELLAVYTETTRRRKPERNGDANAYRQELQSLQAAEKEIESMKKSYQSVPGAIKSLAATPDDPEANYTLGAYLCLVKLRWIDGAQHLTKGSNLRLKVLATEDMAPPVGPVGMVNLANEYWALSEQETGLFKRGLQLRAVYWYRLALPQLSAGLAKVQAERRSQEAEKTYGESLVKDALAMMTPEGAPTVAQGTD